MLRQLLYAFPFVFAFCILSVLYFDRPILLYFEANREPYLPVFTELSRLGWGSTWFVIAGIILLAGLLLRYTSRTQSDSGSNHETPDNPLGFRGVCEKKLIEVGGFALASLIAAGILARFLKWGIGRWRPKFFLEDGIYDFSPFALEGMYNTAAMPSGHSQTVATVCTIIALFKPKWIPFLLPIALLVAISRLVLLHHYLADIVAGLYIGTIVPLLLWHYWHCQRAVRGL